MSLSDHNLLSRNLDGTWLVAPADEELARLFTNPQHDDSSWDSADVPGHWRNTPSLANAEEVLYRHRFEASHTDQKRRSWLSIDGLCYQGDIWLDGGYLGDTEGYFVPHVFEITSALADRAEHVLAIEAACRRPNDLTAKRNITGILQHWDNLDPSLNPGGLWRPVRIEQTGPVRINTLRVTVAEADAERAIIQFHAELDSASATTASVHTLIDEESEVDGSGAVATHEEEHLLSAGPNVLEWRLAVEKPQLWWPHSLGDQPLYDVRVEVHVGGEPSHVRKRRTGFRRIELRNWIASINGERLFLKGTNLGPGSADLASLQPADHERDLQLVRDVGLDLVRPSRPHHAPRLLSRGRSAWCAGVAGLPPPMGIREGDSRPGSQTGRANGQPVVASPFHRGVVWTQRTHPARGPARAQARRRAGESISSTRADAARAPFLE